MPNTSIKQPCRIICEGAADSSFFNSLIKAQGIPNCEADCTRLDNDPNRCAGKNGITETLRGLKGYAETQPGKLRGVVVAIDTDDDPKARLEETIADIKAAGLKCGSRYLDVKPAGAGDIFSIAILGIPWHDKSGNLDLLLFESIQASHVGLMAPLNTFCEQTAAFNGDWKIGPKSIMKLRCTIAASYEDDPGLSLSYLLRRRDCPINFNSGEFDAIATFLRRFVAEIG
jgi:hypothetical protein